MNIAYLVIIGVVLVLALAVWFICPPRIHLLLLLRSPKKAQAYMLKHGEQVIHQRTLDGKSTLHVVTSSGGNIYAAKYLILRGIDVNGQDWHGWTPLHYAACQDDEKFVKLLLDSGARTDIKARDGRTPYDVAMAQGATKNAKILKAHSEK
jgi:ankyrin repeat protein